MSQGGRKSGLTNQCALGPQGISEEHTGNIAKGGLLVKPSVRNVPVTPTPSIFHSRAPQRATEYTLVLASRKRCDLKTRKRCDFHAAAQKIASDFSAISSAIFWRYFCDFCGQTCDLVLCDLKTQRFFLRLRFFGTLRCWFKSEQAHPGPSTLRGGPTEAGRKPAR